MIEDVDALPTAFPEGFMEAARRYLEQPFEWSADIRALLERESREDLAARAARYNLANVEPFVLPLHIDAAGRILVLNHYDADRFGALFAAGSITPHYHHFDFVSRILGGEMLHFEFRNTGKPDAPALEPAGHARLRTGDVFGLRVPEYHCVIGPADDTLTLMLRGKPHFENDFLAQARSFDEGFVEKRIDRIHALVSNLL
ncbi:hypothetical protein [uncultured Methylobacterium sp.]|uniref:hypothetical protein n=1 Tax=uncultured Methylobacterium sp. TaxID=157278 RepID=UPI002603ABA7|nr:hypothetical protein [uncultured Methylobacterium sp.]